MLKELFKKISEQEFKFSNQEKELIDDYIKDDVIIKNGENYEINSKYKIGILKIDKNFAILEDLVNPIKNIKLELDALNGAFNNDLVLAKRVFNPRSKIKAKIIKVIEGKKAEILVYVKDGSFFTLKENIELKSKNTKKYKDEDVLLIDNKEFNEIRFIGNLNEPNIDEFISLYMYEELYRNTEKVEVEEFKEDSSNRIDLRDLPFCTIDPNSAKDHDDAIYFDEINNLLYVAIADVSYFVKEGSDLDKLAFKKSSTIYLPSRTLPMLPSVLSENLCSLKEGQDRYAYVFKLKLDLKKLKVESSELFSGIIKNHRNFSYGRIDRVLDGKLDLYNDVEKTIFDYLIPLYKITKNFRDSRLKNGYDFRTAENRLKLKNDLLENIEVEKSTASHQLIEECMLLANIEASKKVGALGIFRIHEEPDFKALSKLVDDVNVLGVKAKIKDNVHQTITYIQEEASKLLLRDEVDELIIQSLTQAKYSSKNLGHFGLGFKSYSHFTSPIRRYSDLVLHRILKSKKLPKDLDDICTHISDQERKIDKLVWDFEDRKYARWAKANIGNEIKVKIVDTEKAKAVCYDKVIGLKLVIENYKGQKLFSKHRVKIVSCCLATKLIVAILV
ncbi:RNB domain-containing ribonuclease [Aliarcobacter cibarius]|uniref:VacB/RNase II family 3'-5' exoribonuclease n=1 Tax=Aliarcobacter cibarius TaxID=255507 RepID=A0ABY2V632_9BACT|nr:ribonuclease R family protein [Aliarcobacter cibarius]TLT00870.1 VacB/RNase II family 3'-5' exoribonuclease [Aliarcobacter cibarius]TLT01440.1 VacB/RNase II family 3'-5' exoribonuclease [Aliarcobacter cibarius]